MLIKTIFVVFPDVRLQPADIGWFRGLINRQQGWQDALFHNHTDEPNGVIYCYPGIHYRAFHGKAALFGIGEGFETLQRFLDQHLNQLPDAFGMVERTEQRVRLELLDRPQPYTLHQWLGLNTIRNRDGSIVDLEKIWQETDAAGQRAMLERILTAQLLKFCGEMGCRLPAGQLRVTLHQADDLSLRTLVSQTGQTQGRAFRVHYSTNLNLPDQVAFGKGVSKGYGWQVRHKPH